MPPTTKRILLTGFEPFAGEKLNPSWLAVRRLHGRTIAGRVVAARRLPTEFGRALADLQRHLRTLRPSLVICVGQAGGRAEVTPERVALNLDDAGFADNAGRLPLGRPVVTDGPVAYWSTLPVRAIVAALRRRGIPASISLSAGTFVCNHVFYGLMHDLATQTEGTVRGGFIHIPFLPEQAATHPGQPSLPLDLIVKALTIAVRVALRPPVARH